MIYITYSALDTIYPATDTFNRYPDGTESDKLLLPVYIEPGQSKHPWSLTRLFTVG